MNVEAPLHDDLGLTSFAEIARRGIVEVEQEFEGFMQRDDGPGLITAAPDRFKSWTGLLMCVSAVNGSPLFGHFRVPKPRPTAIFLNLDAGPRSTANRIGRLGRDLPQSCFLATWDAWDWNLFERMLAGNRGSFVVIDCWSDLFQLGNARMDPAEAMRRAMKQLRGFYERFGCNGVVVDHASRTEREDDENFSGSQQKKAAIRWGMTLKRDRDDDQHGRIRFGCLKPGDLEPFAPFEVEFAFVDGILTTRFLGEATGSEKRHRQLAQDVASISAALATVGEPQGRRAIERLTGVPRDRVLAALEAPDFVRFGNGPSRRYFTA